jgi:farnesyl-diphosphate farnesyltransferase
MPLSLDFDQLNALLKDVSRSFYLTLRILPGAVRPQIGLAYLLARATDTIADTELVPAASRLEHLEALRQRISGVRKEPFEAAELADRQSSTAEAILLRRIEEGIAALNSLSAEDQKEIRWVLDIITSGQRLDLEHFGNPAPGSIVALKRARDLDDYTYRVAGCVGEFWTRMCRAHLFPKAAIDMNQLLEDGVRFGKGLQLVNIMRDLPVDLRRGRCYLPEEELAAHGLAREMLLDPKEEDRMRPLYNSWLDRAEADLRAGWSYANALPRSQARIRIACALPILIGLRTISLLRQGAVLDPARRIKVSRGEVKRLFLRCFLYHPFQNAWRGLAGFAPATGKAVASPIKLP